jgi:hypothetical protein
MNRADLLAASRHGVIKVQTLAELGVPQRTAHRRCAPGGPWQKVLPGVVLLSDMPPTRRQLVEAALLCAGADSMISGLEACRRFGFRSVPADHRIHVVVPQRRRAFSSPFVVVERARRVPRPVVRDGVPLAPLTRSVLDACRKLGGPDQVRALLTEAVQRHRVAPARLLSELDAGSRRGSALPRVVLKDIVAGARSVAEIDAMRVWERTGLPRPLWNAVLHDDRGEFIAIPDAWFDAGLAWEIDSCEFHFHRDDYARTVARNARYAAAGVPVLQTLPTRLRSAPASVATELIAAHRAAEKTPRPQVHVARRAS